MSQTMVITVTKDDSGQVSATIDSPATTLSSGPADAIGQQIRAIIVQNRRESDGRRLADDTEGGSVRRTTSAVPA